MIPHRWLATGATLGWSLLLVPPVTAQESAAPPVFFEDDIAYYSTEITSVSTYEVEVTYRIYVKGDAFEARVRGPDRPDGTPRSISVRAARIVEFDPEKVGLLACVEYVCRPLAHEARAAGDPDPDRFVFIAVRPRGRDGLEIGEDVRLVTEDGWAVVDDGESVHPVPSVSLALPRVGSREARVLASHPILDLSLSPFTQGHRDEDDDSGASLYFRGGLNAFRPNHRFGLRYSGSVATERRLGFDRIEADLEYERNLVPGDYVPLLLTAGAETDQRLEVVNAVTALGLRFLLPWNVNYSDPEDYSPSSAPLVDLRAELGRRLRDEDGGAGEATPETFQRLGYSIRWRLPFSSRSELRFHHAGAWLFSDDIDDDFHDLWDLTVQARVGDLTYFVGYQQGEAAPLYQPVESTQVGILIRFGDRFQCEKNPEAEDRWKCGSSADDPS